MPSLSSSLYTARTCFVEADHDLAVRRDLLLQQLVLVDLLVDGVQHAAHRPQVVQVLLCRRQPRDERVQVLVEVIRLQNETKGTWMRHCEGK